MLCEKDMSAPQIYKELGDKAPTYRQSINKSLDILENCGLVEKYYDNNKKAICYRIVKKSLRLRLDNLSIEEDI